MKNTLITNILAVIAGVFLGMALNGLIINLSHYIVSPPPGADLKTVEGLKAAIPLMGPIHFLMPFLAHALGTLLSAFMAAKFSASHHMALALGVAALTLLGGIAAAFMIPAPTWFIAVDLILAYLPMGYLGWVLAGQK